MLGILIFILIVYLFSFLFFPIIEFISKQEMIEEDRFRDFDSKNERELGDRFSEFLRKSCFLKEFWGRSFDFTGKTSRRRFWLSVLQVSIVYIFLIGIPIFIYVFASINNSSLNVYEIESLTRNISFISWFGAIINFVPGISLQIRRLNDIGKEPAWVLLSFVPFLSLILIFWYAKPSLKNVVDKKLDKNLSNADELKKYADLRDQGIITEEEFQAKKKKLLDL